MSFFGGGTTQPQQTNFGFGNQPQQQPQQQQQQTSAFGTGLFSKPASTGFGFGGGNTTTTNTSAFSFGTPAAAPTSAVVAPTFAGFGANTTTSTANPFSQTQPTAQQPQSAFGSGTGFNFGAPVASSAPSAFSFGNPNTTAPQQQQQQQPSAFGFSGTSTAPGAFSFSAPKTTASTAPFSFSFPQSQPATSGFGTSGLNFGGNTLTQQPSLFSQPAFGQQTGGSLFAQPQQQQQQQQQQQVDENQAFYQSIFQCRKFGDERDNILANLNYLFASWGFGKGHYSQTLPPVTYTPSNPFYRFKAIGYAFLFKDLNEDGVIILTQKKVAGKVLPEETALISSLQNFIGKPNIMLKVVGTKIQNDEQTQILIYAEDKALNRRILATEFAYYLNSPQFKMQLENLCIVSVSPKVKPSPEQLKEYLDKPPQGIDPRIWKQAQDDNPDLAMMIPVPIIGPEALINRLKWQESENKQHQSRLSIILENVAQLKSRQININSEITGIRRKHATLKHRLIRIIAQQEAVRRAGTTITPEEEKLKLRLEDLNKLVNSPTTYKGALNELSAQIQLQKNGADTKTQPRIELNKDNLNQIKEFLLIEHESLKHIVHTVKSDTDSIKKVTVSIKELDKKLNSLKK